MKISKEIKTALLVLSAILLFILGYSFLKGKDLFSKYHTYYAIYDNVEGLSGSSLITLNGLQIGKVSAIILNSDGTLTVEMQVKGDIPVSKTSIAEIYEPGFIGGKQIAIVHDFKDQNLAINGDTLKTNIKKGMIAGVTEQLQPLQNKVEAAITSVDSLVKNLNSVLDKNNKDNLSIAIANLSQTMKQLNSATATANTMLTTNQKNIDGIMTNFNRTSQNFASISDSIKNANIGTAVKNLETTISSIDKLMADLQSGKGTMGKLMKDEAMYNNLTNASKELELLLADLKNNPKRYMHFSIFGKKNVPYESTKNN